MGDSSSRWATQFRSHGGQSTWSARVSQDGGPWQTYGGRGPMPRRFMDPIFGGDWFGGGPPGMGGGSRAGGSRRGGRSWSGPPDMRGGGSRRGGSSRASGRGSRRGGPPDPLSLGPDMHWGRHGMGGGMAWMDRMGGGRRRRGGGGHQTWMFPSWGGVPIRLDGNGLYMHFDSRGNNWARMGGRTYRW